MNYLKNQVKFHLDHPVLFKAEAKTYEYCRHFLRISFKFKGINKETVTQIVLLQILSLSQLTRVYIPTLRRIMTLSSSRATINDVKLSIVVDPR